MLASSNESSDFYNHHATPWDSQNFTSNPAMTSLGENKLRDMLVIPEDCCPIFDRKIESFDKVEKPLLEKSKSEDAIGSVLDLVGDTGVTANDAYRGSENALHESCYLDDVHEKESKGNVLKRSLSWKSAYVSSIHVTSAKLTCFSTRNSSFNRLNSSLERPGTSGNVTVQYRQKWKDFSIPDGRH